MRIAPLAAAMAVAVSLGAAPAAAQLTRLPEGLYQEALNWQIARSIANKCSSIRWNAAYARAMNRAAREKYARYGLSMRDLSRIPVDEARVQRDVLAYVQRRGIVLSQNETFCRAGAREIRAGSRIGKYLVPR